MRHPRAQSSCDDGMVLPLTLVGTILISVITLAITTYVTADLRYSTIVEGRADRLAAADGGMRFAVEKLRNFQTLCTTGVAVDETGFDTIFPPRINGADTVVTCRRVGTPISDVQGWGVVITGEGVPMSEKILITSGGGRSDASVKTFSGPFYVADPARLDINAAMTIKDGDLWYTSSNCDVRPTVPPLITFDPSFLRGPQCVTFDWLRETGQAGLFRPPATPPPPVSPVNPEYVDTPTCRVFSPGKYTALTLDNRRTNYFKAGAYYFEDVAIVLRGQSLIAGFPGSGGDGPKVDNVGCITEQQHDRSTAAPGVEGATFYLGGSSRIEVLNNAQLEIFRRMASGTGVPGDTFVSIYALGTSGTGWKASSLTWDQLVLDTQEGATNDIAIHGLLWAPLAGAKLGNITQAANGQLLGGIVIGRLDAQGSASASAFLIGVETNPIDTRLLLTSTATRDGCSTRIRAVVQFRPDTGDLAVNSWRVVDQVCD